MGFPGETTVSYTEMAGSPEETRDRAAFKATRVLKCAWADRAQLEIDLLTLPGALYPHRATTLARARSLGIKGFGVQAANYTYPFAIVTVNYESPRLGDPEQPGGSGQPVIAETLQPSAEFLTLDHNLFRWGSGAGTALLEQEAPGRLERGLEYVYKRYNQASIPAAAYAAVGGCNNASVVSATLASTFGPETLLFGVPELERTFTTAGTSGWNLVYRFFFKPSGWNTFWRASTGTYERMYIAGGSQYYNYPLVSFANL